MSNNDLPITHSTKVAALLARYPELEELLIEYAPAFKKLKNPILRKSVAKVASVGQAAAVARVPVSDLVNALRAAVGQEPITLEAGDEPISYFSDKPEWFDRTKVVASIDEREDRDADQMPFARLLHKVATVESTAIVELVTSFVPAPGIDIMKKKGLRVWCVEETPDVIRTYVSKV